MQDGNYYLSVEEASGKTYYLQYSDNKFVIGAEDATGGTAGQFTVAVTGNQLSLYVSVNDEVSGYVNSFVNGGGDVELHLGDTQELFNYTADDDGFQIWTEVTADGLTFEGYFTIWSNYTAQTVYLDQKDAGSGGEERAVQKWKFTVVTIEDIILKAADTSHGG